MKNNKDFSTIVMEKKELLNLVDRCMEELASFEKYRLCDAIEAGEKQGTNWRGELLYLDDENKTTTEDTGIPYMEKIYEYRLPKDPTDIQKAQMLALEKIRETLADLV